jgi:hypothetical protein
MAGPYTGTWRAKFGNPDPQYGSALKQGTGINPVHRIRTIGPPTTATKLNYEQSLGGPGDDTVRMVDSVDVPAAEIETNDFWGYNQETGLRDHPVWDPSLTTPTQRANQSDWPPWGGSRKTSPAGTFIRSLLHGALNTNRTRQVPLETVSEGWVNKPKGSPADSRPSDDSQLIINSSVTQRYKVRSGSQRSGSQSDFNAPIASRVVGQKVKAYSDSRDRRWDMQPYEQDEIIRPFLSRQIGTGYPEYNRPNEMYVSDTLQREPAPDPYQGPVSPDQATVSSDYTYEDRQYY